MTVTLLATVDLGPEIEGMDGRQLRTRMVTIEPEASSARSTTTSAGRAPCTSCRGRSPTIETGSRRTMGRAWAGPRIGTRSTGSRTGERSRRWRSRSTSSRRERVKLPGALFTTPERTWNEATGAPLEPRPRGHRPLTDSPPRHGHLRRASSARKAASTGRSVVAIMDGSVRLRHRLGVGYVRDRRGTRSLFRSDMRASADSADILTPCWSARRRVIELPMSTSSTPPTRSRRRWRAPR